MAHNEPWYFRLPEPITSHLESSIEVLYIEYPNVQVEPMTLHL